MPLLIPAAQQPNPCLALKKRCWNQWNSVNQSMQPDVLRTITGATFKLSRTQQTIVSHAKPELNTTHNLTLAVDFPFPRIYLQHPEDVFANQKSWRISCLGYSGTLCFSVSIGISDRLRSTADVYKTSMPLRRSSLGNPESGSPLSVTVFCGKPWEVYETMESHHILWETLGNCAELGDFPLTRLSTRR